MSGVTGEQGLKGGAGELCASQGGACRALGPAQGKGLGQEGRDVVKTQPHLGWIQAPWPGQLSGEHWEGAGDRLSGFCSF